MAVICGKYKHFRGNEYTVYGTAQTTEGEMCVLYKQNYEDFGFWIRPFKNFFETIEDNGVTVNRFKLTKKIKTQDAFSSFSEEIKKRSIILKHTETKEKYRIISIDENKKQIIVAPYMKNSAYLTDSQIAYRMGYDLCVVNGKKIINKACDPCKKKQMLRNLFGRN